MPSALAAAAPSASGPAARADLLPAIRAAPSLRQTPPSLAPALLAAMRAGVALRATGRLDIRPRLPLALQDHIKQPSTSPPVSSCIYVSSFIMPDALSNLKAEGCMLMFL